MIKFPKYFYALLLTFTSHFTVAWAETDAHLPKPVEPTIKTVEPSNCPEADYRTGFPVECWKGERFLVPPVMSNDKHAQYRLPILYSADKKGSLKITPSMAGETFIVDSVSYVSSDSKICGSPSDCYHLIIIREKTGEKYSENVSCLNGETKRCTNSLSGTLLFNFVRKSFIEKIDVALRGKSITPELQLISGDPGNVNRTLVYPSGSYIVEDITLDYLYHSRGVLVKLKKIDGNVYFMPIEYEENFFLPRDIYGNYVIDMRIGLRRRENNFSGKVAIGDTIVEVEDKLGQPSNRSTTQIAGHTIQYYTYDSGTIVRFQDGIVVALTSSH